MKQSEMPLRQRIAELVDPIAWNGWRGLYRFASRDVELEEDLEARERILAGAKHYADSFHLPAQNRSLELADTIITLTADGLAELLKDAPTPDELMTREGANRYRQWHARVSQLDLLAVAPNKPSTPAIAAATPDDEAPSV